MTLTPLVSVLMTAYNREKYIADAIESVLKSSYFNFELIIVDDCSVDKTLKIIENYAKVDTRIKVYKNEINLGDYPNRNLAASYAKGEFITYVDSDDMLFPETISKILSHISNDSNFNFAMQWYNEKYPLQLNGQVALKKHFFEKGFLHVGPGGTFMKKSFFDKIGGYPEKYGPANDMYFNLKVACNTHIYILPFEFIFYRRHEGQEINNHFSYLYNSHKFIKDALIELPLPFSTQEKSVIRKKNVKTFLKSLVKYFLKSRNIKKTIEAYNRSNFSLRDLIVNYDFY